MNWDLSLRAELGSEAVTGRRSENTSIDATILTSLHGVFEAMSDLGNMLAL